MGDPITLHVLTAKLLCINNKVALLKGPIFPHCLGEDRRVGGDGWRLPAGRDAAVPRVKRDIVWGCADAPQRAVLYHCTAARRTAAPLHRCMLHPRTPHGCITARRVLHAACGTPHRCTHVLHSRTLHHCTPHAAHCTQHRCTATLEHRASPQQCFAQAGSAAPAPLPGSLGSTGCTSPCCQHLADGSRI